MGGHAVMRPEGARWARSAERVVASKSSVTPSLSSRGFARDERIFSTAPLLHRAEIPADLRRGPFAEDTTAAYCDALADIAAPLETDAVASYQGCLTTSTKLGWFSSYSRMCERELGQLQPDKWPTTAEVPGSGRHRNACRDPERPPDEPPRSHSIRND